MQNQTILGNSHSIDFALLQFLKNDFPSLMYRGRNASDSGMGCVGLDGWMEIFVCTDFMSIFGANNRSRKLKNEF